MTTSRSLLPALLSLGLLAACQGREQGFGTGPENPAADKDAGAAARPLAGIYADTMPCNDCQGIATRLTLKPDSLYELQETYLGRTSPVNYRRGPWRVRGQVVTLEPSGNDPVRRYKVEATDQALRLLDATGKPMQDAGQDYTLDRLSAANLSETGTRREFTGKYTYQTSGATFVECGTDKRYTLADAGPGAELQQRYGTTRKQAGQPVFVRVQATVQPGSSGEALAVEKILEMKPDPICPQAQKQAFQQ
ncbi:copper resistance protein NlpE N-terminal domain-containing protein [Hymenobacter sp. HSC-4F20]|uniref:copper resistance protein NlpE n=1 Tax=Hymenobacter sp. HSC-4F20 TaxID=2864135 RepID=UPI001C7342B0|nr:copper resistance protein NlpE [Hymenobacter sp. HSC-4F20]MBX0292839.1 copper resistance protein NlpE N-terminal domain-containing protein [Hymenobacter sp. HSC-4F20]